MPPQQLITHDGGIIEIGEYILEWHIRYDVGPLIFFYNYSVKSVWNNGNVQCFFISISKCLLLPELNLIKYVVLWVKTWFI